MGKYNENENDDYILKYNLLEIDSHKELERAEALAFSLRAMALEQNDFILKFFTLKEFQELHHYLFQDVYPFAGDFRDVQLISAKFNF